MPSESALEKFTRAIHADWLPTYCAARGYSVDGFRPSSIQVTEVDAVDCMRAIDQAVVIDHGGGKYKAPRSAAQEVMFWEGLKNTSPRPITLWIEPVITMAAAARLHLDYGWPKAAIGLQSRKWGFDLVAYTSSEGDREHIVGEIKKTDRELQKLISELKTLSRDSQDTGVEAPAVSRNTRKKWDELLERRPRVLWALGPGGAGVVFTLAYPRNHCAVFTEARPSALNYANAAANPSLKRSDNGRTYERCF